MSLLRSSRRARLVLTAAATLALAVALSAPTVQAAPSGAATPAGWHPAAVDSLVSNLGLSHAEAVQRLEAQGKLTALANRLSDKLGSRVAGTRIDASGKLVVTVLDSAAAATVRAAGASARLAPNHAKLTAAKKALDRTGAPAGISWAADAATGALVVSVPRGKLDATTSKFLAKARATGVPVRVETVSGAFRPMAFFGGEAIFTGGARCSAGFITRSRSNRWYLITAGHCTDIGSFWNDGAQSIGPTVRSSFPFNDYGAIRINNPGSLDPRGGVLHFGGFRDITNAGRVPVGSTVCKTGSTTGTTCGQVLRYNVTVNYAQGTVFGLTETNVCVQPGDSGGSVYAGNQAQAVVSGGTVGGCGGGFRSIHQPADEILNVFGIRLE